MTKAGKILTIAVTVFCVVFMGVAAVMSTVRTDWKEKATKEFPKSTITDQEARLGDLQTKIDAVKKQDDEANAAIAADIKAIEAPEIGRVAVLEAELAKLIDDAHAVFEQSEAEARKVDAKQEEDKRLREVVTRLRSQYEDLVAQKDDALADVKRLRDLLFQAKGILDRVEKRQKSLELENSY